VSKRRWLQDGGKDTRVAERTMAEEQLIWTGSSFLVTTGCCYGDAAEDISSHVIRKKSVNQEVQRSVLH